MFHRSEYAIINLMMTLLSKWIINALAIFLVGHFLPGIHVSDMMTAIWVAAVLALINTIIRPILLILTLPINILSLGIFTFVLNGLLFWFSSYFIKTFTVDGLWWAILGALLVSVISTILNRIALGKDGKVGGT